MDLSIVVPIYNEVENLSPLHKQLSAALAGLGRSYEILFIDDGSSDDGPLELRRLASADPLVKVVLFRRNYGQTAAMQAGLDLAVGDVLVTLDGDLQNDPGDIRLLLDKMDQGYDLVHGWRKDRHDAWLHRTLPSKVANWLISKVTGFPIHDLGCTLKAMRSEIAKEIELYGEMHRFIPILAHQHGAKCAEVVVRHHPRRFGRTKYGLSRTIRVALDLITVKFLLCWLDSPMKLFGRLGAWCALAGAMTGAAATAMKVTAGVDLSGNPLLLLAICCWLSALQLGSLGLLGELCTRLYYSHAGRRPYAIGQRLNFDVEPRKIKIAA